MSEARVNIRRLLFVLLLGVIFPICTALLIDLSFDTLPFATIAALVIFLPLGAFWLSRVSLGEFNRVIAEVAPEDDDAVTEEDPCDESSDPLIVRDSGRETSK